MTGDARWWRSRVVVLVACVVAAASFAGTITLPALLLALLPGLAIASGTAALVTRIARPLPAAVVGVLVALGWAELVNVLSGDGNGPAARSTFAASTLTALAVVALSSPLPAAFLPAVAGVVASALALGAGAEVQAVAVLTALTAVVALAVVEGEHRRWAARAGGTAAVVVLALLSAAAAAVVWVALDHQLDRAPYEVAAVVGEPAIRPPGSGARTPTPTPIATVTATARPTRTSSATPSPTRTQRATPSARPTTATVVKKPVSTPGSRPWATRLLLGLALLLVMLLVVLIVRLLWVALRWRLLRRRLHRGGLDAAVVGAWIWARYRLRSRGVSMPRDVSPDRVRSADALGRLPRRLSVPLLVVADAAVRAAFADEPDLSPQNVEQAWRSADAADAAAQSSQRPVARFRSALTVPADGGR